MVDELIVKENIFWEKEREKYLQFKNKNPQTDYNHYFPEKTYPAYLTYLTIYHLINKLKNPRVLEAGCGLGISLFFLGNSSVKCLGIDHSKEAIKFANFLKPSIMKKNSLINVEFCQKTFLAFTAKKRYDLVFNSGVLEHLSLLEQNIYLKKMVKVSKQYIMLMIPNTKSLVFKAFIRRMSKQNRKYTLKHKIIDIDKLFATNGVKLIKRSGRNIWLNGYVPQNDELSKIYNKYFSKFTSQKPINANRRVIKELAKAEHNISDNDLFNHAFTRVYIGEINT